MAILFDLKNYLKLAAFTSTEELAKMVLEDKSGLDEYIHEIHHDGASILAQHVTGDEIDHLLSLVAGVSTGKMLESPEITPTDKVLLLSIMTGNASFMKALTLSIMCAAIGLVTREEWR